MTTSISSDVNYSPDIPDRKGEKHIIFPGAQGLHSPPGYGIGLKTFRLQAHGRG